MKTSDQSECDLFLSNIPTSIGEMTVVSNKAAVLLLGFRGEEKFEKQLAKIPVLRTSSITPGTTALLDMLKKEISDFFEGRLKQFETPLNPVGTPFQKRVWDALLTIPYGKTISYKSLAERIGQPTACRAVANANAKNPIAILIPCHRVIESSGSPGGYAGGVHRKTSLLKLECCH